MAKKRAAKQDGFEDPAKCKKKMPYGFEVGEFIETHMMSLYYIKRKFYNERIGKWVLEILYLRLPWGYGYREEALSIEHDMKESKDFLLGAYQVKRPHDLPSHLLS